MDCATDVFILFCCCILFYEWTTVNLFILLWMGSGSVSCWGLVRAACWEHPSARVLEQCTWASRGTAVLKVRSGDTPRGVLSVKTIFIKMLRCYLPFTFILLWVYTGDPEVMWHAVLPLSDGWWNVCCEYCWTLKMAQFSFLTLRSVDGYNPYKQWLLGALIFKSVKESWKENFENCLLL